MILTKKITLFILIIFSFSAVLAQTEAEWESMPDPDPQYRNDNYEVIILDGKKVIRDKYTKEIVYGNKPQPVVQNSTNNSTLIKASTTGSSLSPTRVLDDSQFNINWDTTVFNPYKNEPPIDWPIQLNFYNETFTMPVVGTVTSRYGWRRGRPHKGIDIDLVTGDPVKSAMDGKVRFAKYYSGFGNMVVVRHRNGLETIYGHLSKILVQPNQMVYSGQVIGRGGNTGRSRGSHLHFEVKYKNTSIHPEYLFDLEKNGMHNYRAESIIVDKRWASPGKHRSYRKSNISVKRPYSSSTSYASAPSSTGTTIHRSSTGSSMVKNSSSGSSVRKPSQPLNRVPAKEYHVIRKGDSLGRIASKYSTSISKLCKLNGLKKTSILRIGRQIRIR